MYLLDAFRLWDYDKDDDLSSQDSNLSLTDTVTLAPTITLTITPTLTLTLTDFLTPNPVRHYNADSVHPRLPE